MALATRHSLRHKTEVPGTIFIIVLDTKTLWGRHVGSFPDFSQPIKSQIRTEYRGVNVPVEKDQCPQPLKCQNFYPGCSLVSLK